MQRIAMIAAIGARTRAIGKNNDLLWHIPKDAQRFKDITMGHPVIMGRRTWESIPEKFRPLPGRANIVVTREDGYDATGATVVTSLDAAIQTAKEAAGSEEIFIVGGGQMYSEAFPRADRLYLTLIDDDAEGDTFFPEYEKEFAKIISDERYEWNGLKYRFIDLAR